MQDSRLLVLDADPETRDVVRRVGQDLGFSVVVPSLPCDLDAGLTAIGPSVVFLDPLLPERQGVEIIRRLGDAGSDARIVLAAGPDRRALRSARRLAARRGLRIAGTAVRPVRREALAAILTRLRAGTGAVDEAELAEAIAQGELSVHYQPKVAAAEGNGWRLDSLEALVRWEHPRLGRLTPDAFIPLAEKTGLIVGLTEHVIETVLRQLGAWRRRGLELPVAVNLSARVVDDLSLPDRLVRRLAAHGVESRHLILEITESSAIVDATRAMDVLARLRLKGFQLSVDDFGTGHSSLIQLHRIPFTELKIDREFVHGLPGDSVSANIVKGIVDLAHALELTVCVEGVESGAAFAQLREFGCDLFQGFHFAAALSSAAVTRLLEGHLTRSDDPTDRDVARPHAGFGAGMEGPAYAV